MPDRVLRVKEGVQFTTIAPGGFRILEALSCTARKVGVDLTITCACEKHPPDDPHTLGKAYDVRSHDLGEFKPIVLNALQALLPAAQFFIFLESPGTNNEHFHCQVAKGTQYP